ncbi:hypothetical protein PIB30_034311 [Stylosanthes scabra]|uniref:Uncharacterized protein n=1 Tax=Stylosanthes scabra TaxID=79078 RepID=A0ABU6RCX7_9FABA|nr:hypothetical protein [Stylosanthes scabra]
MSNTMFAVFLLSAFISNLPSTIAQVSDIHGRPVRNPGSYFILPALTPNGFGVQPEATGNETCPLTVVKSSSQYDLGRRVRLSSVLRIAFLPIDSPLDIEFDYPDECAASGKWTVVNGVPEDSSPSLKLSGYNNVMRGSFRVRALGFRTYKLSFCEIDNNCQDVGVQVDKDGNERLVLTDKDPFAVVFLQPYFGSAAQ